MILTSREAEPQIARALEEGTVIGDDVAATIADWFKTPYDRDRPLSALAHGCQVDAVALLDRVDEMLSDIATVDDLLGGSEDAESGKPGLTALRAWALARVPHVVVTEYAVDADTWEAWGRGEAEPGDDGVPAGVEPIDTDVTVLAHVAANIGAWITPGEPGYPATPAELARFEVDPADGTTWVPASLVDAAAAALAGDFTGFWAQSYGGDPFGPGLFWENVGTFEQLGAGRPYASRYIHPGTGDVEIRVARLVGLSPEQEAEVHDKWREA